LEQVLEPVGTSFSPPQEGPIKALHYLNVLKAPFIRNVHMRVKIKIDLFGYFYWLSIRKWSR